MDCGTVDMRIRRCLCGNDKRHFNEASLENAVSLKSNGKLFKRCTADIEIQVEVI